MKNKVISGRGVFCDIGCVTPVSGNVGKITSMMEQNNNFDVWNQPVLNITLSERNNQAGPTHQQPSNSLRMIHNDLRGLFLQVSILISIRSPIESILLSGIGIINFAISPS